MEQIRIIMVVVTTIREVGVELVMAEEMDKVEVETGIYVSFVEGLVTLLLNAITYLTLASMAILMVILVQSSKVKLIWLHQIQW